MQIRYLFIFLLLVSMPCCKRLDVYTDFGNETINGFNVKWNNNITAEQRDIIKNILNDMVLVQGGRFLMGATREQEYCLMVRNNEYPVHMVELNDFYICRHEMTYEQIKELCSWKYLYELEWQEAASIKNMMKDFTGLDFDIPTEAQWEYAARGGQSSKGYTYPGSNSLYDVWNEDSDILSTVPNELGIYNLGDGRSEWCKDYYYEYKNNLLDINPCYCSESQMHVLRGGGSNMNRFKLFDPDNTSSTYSSSHISCRSISNTYNIATLRPVINK